MLIRFGVILLLVYHSSCTNLTADDETWTWAQKVYNNSRSTTTAAPSEIEEVDLDPTDDDPTEACLLPNGLQGVCVPYYLCDSDTKQIIQDGTTLINFRGGQCLSYLDICCKMEHSRPPQDTMTTPIPIDKFTQDKMWTKPVSSPLRPAEAKEAVAVSIEIKDKCGWEDSGLFLFRKNTEDPQIYADFGQFRWMVAIIKKKRKVEAWNSEDYIGGGSIIHPSVVITAAHKVYKRRPRELKCRGGEWDTQTTKEMFKFQEQDVTKIIVHPQFYNISLYYDVALLILNAPFDLQLPHMGIACLNRVLPPPKTQCYSMGWGRKFNQTGEYAVILKKINLALVAPQDCQSRLRKSRLGPFFTLHSSLTCAGGEKGVDTCDKDGGSSLVCPIGSDENNVRYAVVGIVSYGIGCGVENRPGVYVNVPQIYSWVDEVMMQEKYD
ncbi:unnamed protein product, partial [Brenthis ino]